jgi:hypothetical protein
MGKTCFVCDSPDLVEPPVAHSPTCAAHVSAHDHVVSMQSEPAPYGASYTVAVCPCGWSVRRLRGGKEVADEMTRLVRAHWLSIAEAGQ